MTWATVWLAVKTIWARFAASKFGQWCKKYMKPVLTGAVLLAVAEWYWRQRLEAARVEQAHGAVISARREIDRLSGERAQLKERVGEKDAQIAVIDAQIADNKKRVLEVLGHDVSNMSVDDVIAKFASLGY